jgi:Tol biopolymer transport system component
MSRATIRLAVMLGLIGAAVVAGAAFGGRRANLPGTLAFTGGTVSRGWDIFLARPGRPIAQMNHGELEARYPLPSVWSPDGSQLLVESVDGFLVFRPNRSVEIRVIPTSSSGGVAWAPDSTRIAFQAGDGISLVDTDGSGGLRQLVAAASHWSWSPDGKRIAFVGDDQSGLPGVFLVNTTGAPQTTQIPLPTPVPLPGTAVDYTGLAWSPDGSQLAFLCCSNWWNHSWLYVVKLDGTGLRRVHHGVEGDTIRWSPDGRRIAFSTGYDESNWNVMNADGTGVRSLCRGCTFAWFPDGSKIGFDQAGRISVAEADGSHPRTVVARSRRYENFSISPDGSTIAYVGRNRLYAANSDGTARRLVAHSRTVQYSAPSWRPTGR